jgi:phage portal protein BeeE
MGLVGAEQPRQGLVVALLDRIAQRLGFVRERRDAPSWSPPMAGNWSSASYGSSAYWENLSVVTACVQAISSALASLPAAIYRIDGDKRTEAPDHPLAELIKRPNHLQTWPDFLEWLVASTLLYGNGVASIDYDASGAINSLSPVPWWQCQPVLIPASPNESLGPTAPSARLAFDVMRLVAPWGAPFGGGTGMPRRLFADTDVVFLKDRSDNGILGRSRLSRSPDVVNAALGAQGFSANVWQNGALLGGVASHPGRLSKESADRIAQSFKDTHSGPQGAGRILVLEEGMQFEAHATSPEDAELLASRRFSVEEIARIYCVPLPIINEWSHSTFTNSDTATIWMASLCLLPWVTKIEREWSRSVIQDDRYTLGLDLSGMMRGNHTERVQANVAMVRSGILSADEARASEGYNPRGGSANELVAQSVGGRPDGQGDGLDVLPPAKPNGAGKGNGAAV